MGNALMTLQGFEIKLAMYREQVMGGWLGMGRTLVAAQESGVVPHGQWISWVESNAGIGIRDAQRLMELARAIPEDSPLAKLTMTAARQLMRLPADEREEWAEANGAADMSTRQLKVAIDDELKAAREAQERAEAQLRDSAAKWAQERKGMIDRSAKLQTEFNNMKTRADNLDKQVEDLVNRAAEIQKEYIYPEDYEALKTRDMTASKRIQQSEEYADRQQARVRELQDQLMHASENGQRADLGAEFHKSSGAMLAAIQEILVRQDISEALTPAEQAAMVSWISTLETQLRTLRNRLRTAPVGGAGYVR